MTKVTIYRMGIDCVISPVRVRDMGPTSLHSPGVYGNVRMIAANGNHKKIK